ncbi:conserved Plasmodium protein, unknown function [Plasmodium vinckei brucechwatti]|uniref:Uncharacterized protein n=1 Tax=Plasmodium vinckei brucechwatti TaxID=119398 RepID=A0A6V7SWS5_PLAVN|nr:conserved Plasmodium protein, unknown function [Plasmodium vinckei brucechwatti]
MEQNSKNALDRSEEVANNENIIFFGGAGLLTRVIITLVNILMLTNLLLDINISCDGYLRTWIIGASILSFFLMSFIRRVPTFLKEDKGLLSELILMAIFFIWTYFGTIQINKSNACQKIAPHLFWTVFYCRIDFKFNDYNNRIVFFYKIKESEIVIELKILELYILLLKFFL